MTAREKLILEFRQARLEFLKEMGRRRKSGDSTRYARLNTDGTVDSEFDPDADNAVEAIAIQRDGKILIGGAFSTLKPRGIPQVIGIMGPDAFGVLKATFGSCSRSLDSMRTESGRTNFDA